MQLHTENVLHHTCRIGVYLQFVPVIRFLLVAIDSKRTDKLAVPPLYFQLAPYLDGNIPAVCVID